MCQFGVETCFFATKVRDTEASGDAGTGEDNDVGGALEEVDDIGDGVVLGKFETFGEFARDAEGEERYVGCVGGAVEECGGSDAECCAELLGGYGAGREGFAEKGFFAEGAEAVAVGVCFAEAAGFGVWEWGGLAGKLPGSRAEGRGHIPPSRRW